MCGKFKFHSNSPMLIYYQKALNSCCFRSLASDFASTEQTKSENVISLCIEEYLKCKVGNRIDFSNTILKRKKILKANQEYIIA